MPDRVLDERLQDESRDETVDRALVHVVIDAEPIGEADALDVEIGLDGQELVAERHLVGARRERVPKDGGELAQHARGGGERLVSELRHGPERVE